MRWQSAISCLRPDRRRVAAAFFAMLCSSGAVEYAAAQQAASEFPARPVRILVGFAPGGGTDITARIIAKRLAEQIRQQVIVENRAGGGGVVAMELLAAAAPDGYTILLGAVGPFAVTPHMQKVSYDVVRDFAPLTMGVVFPNVVVIHASLSATSLSDYLALARPGFVVKLWQLWHWKRGSSCGRTAEFDGGYSDSAHRLQRRRTCHG